MAHIADTEKENQKSFLIWLPLTEFLVVMITIFYDFQSAVFNTINYPPKLPAFLGVGCLDFLDDNNYSILWFPF